MKGITDFSDSIIWFDPTCSGGEDVRGMWSINYGQKAVLKRDIRVFPR